MDAIPAVMIPQLSDWWSRSDRAGFLAPRHRQI